jgi:hypothetical protein
MCRMTSKSSGNLVLRSVEHVMTPIIGGTANPEFANDCATDELVVGVNVRFVTSINAVGPICARANDWARRTTSVTRSLPLKGGAAGQMHARMCPHGSFLSGLNVWQTNGLNGWTNGLQTVCRRLL